MSTGRGEHSNGPRGRGDRAQAADSDETASPFGPLDSYADVVPPGTVDAWTRLAPIVPGHMYLVGGTALALYLRHRSSRDLDLFSEQRFDAPALAETLGDTFHDFVPTEVSDGTVNGILGNTKVQFLDASSQQRLCPTMTNAGIRVASIEDILATKIKVVMDRGELRDYFDLKAIEEHTDLDIAEGLSLYLDRYRPATPDQHLAQIVRALGYFDDVTKDPGLPDTREQIAHYWSGRQRELLRFLR